MAVLAAVKEALQCADPAKKITLTKALKFLSHQENEPVAKVPTMPGRPAKPELVAPKLLPKRGVGSVRGVAALMHSVAHIEFNAINLALDMVLRFARDDVFESSQVSTEFIADWISVAVDEARHFEMVDNFLRSAGFSYGTFPAHDGLWDAAKQTSHDIAARLALAPMVLEARGLDVTPHIIEKLRKNNEPKAVAILEVILKEEVQHVYFGTKWFNFVAQKRGKMPETYFQSLVRAHYRGTLKKPFNKKARIEAELYEDFYLPLS